MQNMKHYLSALIVLLVLCIATIGCRTAVSSAGTTVHSYAGEKIEVGSKLLGDRIEVVGRNVVRRNSLLAADIVAINKTESEYQCEYRYTWFDQDGMEVPTTTSVWKPAHFHGRARVNMQGIGPSKNASHFKLVLRFRKSTTRF